MTQFLNLSPLFYISLGVLAAGLAGSLYFFVEWFKHRQQHVFMLFWAIGLLSLDWFQIPTVIALTGRQIIYTSFNNIFMITLPLSFFGFLMIYLGLRMICNVPPKKSTYMKLSVWFIMALVFYGFQSVLFQTRPGLIAQMLFFLVPVQLLNLSVIGKTYRSKNLSAAGLSKIGLFMLALSIGAALLRYAFYIYNVFIYPPSIALVLIRFSPFYISTQIIGIVFLMVGFLFMHEKAIASKPSGNN